MAPATQSYAFVLPRNTKGKKVTIMSVSTGVLGEKQQEVMDNNKGKKKLLESALPDSLNIT